jgi:hypothetical protein
MHSCVFIIVVNCINKLVYGLLLILLCQPKKYLSGFRGSASLQLVLEILVQHWTHMDQGSVQIG